MRYVSLFSGIEAATVAWGPLGWEPMAFSEIDQFPCAVLEYRFPDVPNLGDVSKIDWGDFIAGVRRPDVVVGGSPCQSFSIAGTRSGLKGASGLMFEYIRAVRELMPTCFLWENVPGALTSDGGDAYRQLLSEMDELGYGLAWRVLDAQFFGVAQRRRRIFLVGVLGDPACACQILFERAGVPWDYQPSREKRQELAARPGGSPTGAGAVLHATGFSWHNGGNTNLSIGDTSPCIGSHMQPATAVRMREGREGGGKGPLVQRGVSGTLATGNDQTIFCRGITDATPNAATVGDADGAGIVVRRLTPTECERLQGFQDGWTDVPYRGCEHAPDTPRYKAIGNSMAVPVMRWIGKRIAAALLLRGED